MSLTFYYASGSPYAWRVWLALEHVGAAYELKTISFDAGDLKAEGYRRLNPRGRVPVLVDGGFALYESAAIVEYLADKYADQAHLFSADMKQRAIERRMVREADQYFAEPMEKLVSAILFTPQEKWDSEKIVAARTEIAHELAFWETAIAGDYLAGDLSAADFTLYPLLALVQRMAQRRSDLAPEAMTGPKITDWAARMEALAVVQKTWPPHWR